MDHGTQPAIPRKSAEPTAQPIRMLVILGCLGFAAITLVLVSSATWALNPDAQQTWREHRDRVRLIPEEAYRYDRFRAIRGRVTQGDNRPASGAIVRCSRLDKLLGLAKVGPLSPPKWSVPIEAEVVVGPDGNYEFPHLDAGAYTFFYSAPGLCPAIKELVVVQDGVGAVLDVTLGQPDALRVKLDVPLWPGDRLTLVPSRWWPELPTAIVGPLGAAEFTGLGGPLRKGLIVSSSGPDAPEWRVVGRYDLDVSGEARIGFSPPPASVLDLPEATIFEPRGSSVQPAKRMLYAAVSPIALFWPVAAEDASFLAAMADFRAEDSGIGARGSGRGFGPQACLPVLAESAEGGAWLAWSSDAAEFDLTGLPAGPYKLRALDLFGGVTFGRGMHLTAGASTKLPGGVWTKPDPAEVDSREIMGFVRWEGGLPAAKAVVFVQHRADFRLYLRRVEADEHGYYRVSDVPGGEFYFAFAVPPGEEMAARQLIYFQAPSSQKEVWQDLTLNGHRVVGQFPGNVSEVPLQLVRSDPGRDEIIFSFRTDARGSFSIANVPHGHYCVQSTSRGGTASIRSLPIEVVEGRIEENTRWP